MEPERKNPEKAAGQDWGQMKQTAKFWLPACMAFTAILLIFSILLTYVLATDAQRKRDLRTIAEQKREEEAQKEQEAQNRPDNLATLESILNDRALYGSATESEEFLQAVFELYKEKSGDAYAEYYTEEAYSILYSQLSGQTIGIGVTLKHTTVLYEDREVPALLLRSVLPGSSAEQSGLIVGEWILAVGNGEEEPQSIAELGGYDQAVLALRGEEGTEVTLRVLGEKDGVQSVREVICLRQPVEARAASGYLLENAPGVAVIRISEFSFNMPAQFRTAIEDCRARGATNFILDVRDNSGGSLIALSAVLSSFLQNEDVIFSEKRADSSVQDVVCIPRVYGGDKESCTVTEEQIGQYRNAGLSFAVLCNENTASAAELFAATLAENGIAAVFGQRTKGKWVAQSTIEVPFKGFKAYIRFTAYQCITAGGATYQGVGYTPAYEVALAEGTDDVAIESLLWEQDLQLQAAVASFKSKP